MSIYPIRSIRLKKLVLEWAPRRLAALLRLAGSGMCPDQRSTDGSQPTSLRFMKSCSSLKVNQAFTSYNNPKGNADTERMMRTLKEELLWLREWPSATELTRELDRWIEYYNESYLHSALGYRPPNWTEENYNLSRDTLLKSA